MFLLEAVVTRGSKLEPRVTIPGVSRDASDLVACLPDHEGQDLVVDAIQRKDRWEFLAVVGQVRTVPVQFCSV